MLNALTPYYHHMETMKKKKTASLSSSSSSSSSSQDQLCVQALFDPKLLHLVRKLTSKKGGGSATTVAAPTTPAATVDHVVTQLRLQHREYQRKDLEVLTTAVEAVLQHLSSSSSSRKRSLEDNNEDEQQYDRAAIENDAYREQTGAGGGLNASLCNRYRRQVEQQQQQQQKSREVAAATTAAAAVSNVSEDNSKATTNAAVVVVVENNNNNNNNNKDETIKVVEAVNENTATTVKATSTNSNNNSKPKRRKLKKRSSTLNNNKSSSFGDFVSGTSGGGDADNVSNFLSPVPRPTERYSDLGGMHDVIQQIRQLVEYPVVRPELYQHLGVDPPRGVLLRGPPGTGKTHLANAVAGQLGVPFFRVSAPELVSGMSGESESRIRTLFQTASDMAPSIIFLDELDAIAPKRSDSGNTRGMEKRMVAQLLTCMDMVAPANNRQQAAVIVLAATNRPDAMDAALRRAGRFDKEILLGVPDEEAREKIIQTMTKGMRLSGNFDFQQLARKTPGFVGADVKSLAKEAAVIAINRIFHNVLKDQNAIGGQVSVTEGSGPTSDETTTPLTPLTAAQMEPLFVSMDDFLEALPLVQPSSKREGFATVPDVSWDNIGALHSIREELTISVLEPIRSPEKFKALGLSPQAGVLLYGPPGCGKTLLAKAIAHESGANFISVKGPELLDKYVGESERAVRLVFERARASSPCVVFFDELDSLVPKRGADGGSGGGVSERVVNQLLTEMDGLESRRSVFVIAATNRPELIDPAMLRPGRLDKLLYVPLPTPEDRVSILQALAKNVQIADDVSIDRIGKSPRAEGYSGADCAALLREAGLAVLKEDAAAYAAGKPDSVPLIISNRHFDAAFSCVLPSVSKKDQARYDRIRSRITRARSRSAATTIADKADGDDDDDNGLVNEPVLPTGGGMDAVPPDDTN